MKTAIAAGMLLALGATLPGAAQTLETPSFIVTIDVRCAEGNVTCDDVRYTGTSKKTGKSITLRGRTMHSKCADGVTPCQFQGYVFRQGASSYTITPADELLVMQGEKTLLKEQGTWQPAADAAPCVKVRAADESLGCMKFSAQERKKAAALGLQLGAPFAQVKRHLASSGWALDRRWLDQNQASAPTKEGLVCGSGWDAVCTTTWRKNRQTVSLTLSGTNNGTPLIGVELEAAP